MRRRTSIIVMPLAGMILVIIGFHVGQYFESVKPSSDHPSSPVLALDEGHADVLTASARRVVCAKWSDDSKCVRFDLVLRPHGIVTLTIVCALIDRQGQSLNRYAVADKVWHTDGTASFTHELDALNLKRPSERPDISTMVAQIEVWGDFEKLQVLELSIQTP